MADRIHTTPIIRRLPDKRIFELREKGYTQAEIASELGFKNHSAVTKRLDAMKKKFEKFIKE